MRKSNLLQIRLTDDEKQKLETLAKQEQTTVSGIVRQLINSYITTQPLLRTGMEELKVDPEKNEMPKWSNRKRRALRVGEMFSGPGGIGLALSQTNLKEGGYDLSFKHCWATDYDVDTCKTYRNNLLTNVPDALSICEDIKNVDVEALPSVDGFLYGFPCNDFSLVGESLGIEGRFGGLYKYGVDYITRKNPLFIFAENVSGISSSNAGNTFIKILEELNWAGAFGYNLSVHHYKFENYGIPQARHRYIIIGIRGDLGLHYKVPKPSGAQKSCRSAIEHPPINSTAMNHELTKQSKVVIERLKHILPGQNAWTANLPEHLKLNVKGAKISQIYKRLNPDKPSYTVTGSGGGGTHVYHWQEPRALTNRERARLQTFPDDFIFYGSKESVRSQIGMAVPVDGARIILKSLLKTFAKQTYDSVEPSYGQFDAKSI